MIERDHHSQAPRRSLPTKEGPARIAPGPPCQRAGAQTMTGMTGCLNKNDYWQIESCTPEALTRQRKPDATKRPALKAARTQKRTPARVTYPGCKSLGVQKSWEGRVSDLPWTWLCKPAPDDSAATVFVYPRAILARWIRKYWRTKAPSRAGNAAPQFLHGRSPSEAVSGPASVRTFGTEIGSRGSQRNQSSPHSLNNRAQ